MGIDYRLVSVYQALTLIANLRVSGMGILNSCTHVECVFFVRLFLNGLPLLHFSLFY